MAASASRSRSAATVLSTADSRSLPTQQHQLLQLQQQQRANQSTHAGASSSGHTKPPSVSSQFAGKEVSGRIRVLKGALPVESSSSAAQLKAVEAYKQVATQVRELQAKYRKGGDEKVSL